MVWLVPLVALGIGLWLAYRHYVMQGPLIDIRFKSAAGLQAGKTKVKYRDVEVGEVKSILVSEDLKSVIVRARLVAGAEEYLREKTRFWVERPRVSAGRVSGLETLLSGPYIAVDPVTQGPETHTFIGLEEPPLFTTAETGTQFLLRSEQGSSLKRGAPVYYRSIPVGRVIGAELAEGGKAVVIKIFIASPHDRLVLTTTRFWNASGIDVTLGTDGVQIHTESLLSLLIGGIAFDNPDSLEETGKPAEKNHRFPLYPNRERAYETLYPKKERYILFFQDSVRGLEVNAPVMLQGIPIGRVLDIKLRFDEEAFQFLVPVLIEIEPARIGFIGDPQRLAGENLVERLVEKGLRGQLRTGSLLTGKLYIELGFHEEAPPAQLSRYGEYKVLPSMPLETLTQKANAFLDRLQALPLQEIGKELQDTLAGANDLVHSETLSQSLLELQGLLTELRQAAQSIDGESIPAFNAALQQLHQTLASAEQFLSPNATLYLEVQRALRELSAAARSIRSLTDYLERHPEALLQGKRR